MMPARNKAAKQQVQRLLAELPDDVSLEDVQYHLYVLQHIGRGRRDIDEGRVLSQKEVQRRMARWLERSAGEPPTSTRLLDS